MDAEPFTTLINQVIKILTSFIHDTSRAGGAFTTEVGKDTYQQGENVYEAVRTRFDHFDHETDDGKATRVLENFMTDPEEYSGNFQKRLLSLLQADPDFAKKLRQIVSPPPLFIRRDQELDEYACFLREDSPWIWIFTALEGSGKSSLLKQMKEKTKTLPDTPVIEFDFASERDKYNPSTGKREPINALGFLSKFAPKLMKQCERYNEFEEELKGAYKASSIDNILIIKNIQNLSADSNSTLKNNEVNITMSRAALLQEERQEKRKKEWSRMALAFLQLMDSFRSSHLVIQLDACEWLMEEENVEVRIWLLEEILLPLCQRMQQIQKKCHVVMMSNVALPPQNSEYIEQRSLRRLDELAVERYLQRIGVDDAELRGRFYDMTDGHADCVKILCELWQRWKSEGEQMSHRETIIQFQKDFIKEAKEKFIEERILGKFDKPPLSDLTRPLYDLTRSLHDLTKYGILLRGFNLPLLKKVFPKLLPELGAENVFKRFINRSYIERTSDYKYAVHGLLRTVLGEYIRVQEPKNWQLYHGRAMSFFKDQAVSRKLLC